MTWTHVLTEDVLAEIFATHRLRILRDARNSGGLSEKRYDDSTAFVEHYHEQKQRLCDLTRDWYHGDYNDATEMRSEITKLAKGHSGSIAQLLDLADITLVREVRLPEFSRNWSDTQRRHTLVRTLAHSCSIESLYGHFVAYRHLYEQRDRHRQAAMDPKVDARKTLDELVGSLVVVGPGVPDLEDELRSALHSPGELHDDAPEIAVRIPIRTSATQNVIARTTWQISIAKASTQLVKLSRYLMGSSRQATMLLGLSTTALNERIDVGRGRSISMKFGECWLISILIVSSRTAT